MTTILQILKESSSKAIAKIFDITDAQVQITATKPEFDGDYTVVLFSLVKALRKSPEEIGETIGKQLLADEPYLYTNYNVIKGFLNLTIHENYYNNLVQRYYQDICFGKKELNGKKVMVEYSSPNTNKPLHLGHLRNNFLGWSIAEIYKANGFEVIKSCIVNDRGIHICKSMIAWQLYGNGDTPQSTQTKGDHFVGDYYVKFNDVYKAQMQELCDNGMDEKTAEKEAPIFKEAQDMLLKWEQGDAAVMDLWRTMNSWVYEGFDTTYKNIGSDFEKTYYESNTYLLGKDIVQQGIASGVFFKKEDGSVWIDLTEDGLDQKLVQRKDGTSVYITQDIGLAQQKYDQYKINNSIYVIGNEQDYHMAVLKLICQKLGMPYANDIHHLSYGMVELPSGKMKSREGTVVDADDLVQAMLNKSAEETAKHGKTNEFTTDALAELYNTIGLGAMKFYLLRVDPKKKMIFNPEESIEFQGFTGPFVQYTHARIKSILRKNNFSNIESINTTSLLPLEKALAKHLEQYPTAIDAAYLDYNPSAIAIYAFELAKVYNSFYAEHSVANAESDDKKNLRLQLSSFVATVLNSAMQLLGIQVPERM